MGNVAAEDFPDGNGEFQIGLNPDPSFPYTGTLQEAFGGNNFVENPRLTKYARPILPSPAVGPQFSNGHAGGFYPAGDINNDNHLTAPDLHGFRIAYDDPNPNTLITSIFDFNGDDQVTLQDFQFFKEGYEGPTHFTCEGTSQVYTIEDIITGVIEDADQNGIPELNNTECQPINVPAASAWTLISMALLTAISGTLVLRTRKVVGSAVRTIPM